MVATRILLACVMAVSVGAHAQKSCSKADAAAAEKAIDRVVNWQGLYKAYKDYRHCDTGPVDELYTDALLRMMVEWKNVDAIAGDSSKDAEYKAWIHKHLLSPAAKDDRESVYSRAKASCPAKHEAFCAELAEVVKTGKSAAAAAASGETLFEPLKPIAAPK